MTPSSLVVRPARALAGSVSVPGDKSISHRYVLLGGIASGRTSVAHLAPGADVAASIQCIGALGARIEWTGPNAVTIEGVGTKGLSAPAHTLDAANSGTTMRLLTGLVAGYPIRVTIAGDESLSRRPMRRVLDPISAMGARVSSNDGRPPISIEGGALTGTAWTSPVPSAQVKSAVLLAGLRASGQTSITEPAATRDHSERAFPVFGLVVQADGLTCRVNGGQRAVAPSRPMTVPGDPSSAAMWAAAAAALPGSRVRLDGVCLNPHRTGFLRALERMGAVVRELTGDTSAGEPTGTLEVEHGRHQPTVITPAEVPGLIDELPVLAARAALGGGLEVSGASELRVKESDRITALVKGFRQLGVNAEERPDGFVIDGGQCPTGGSADAAGDHRLVLAFTLVALGASGPTEITGAHAVAVSYPDFVRDLEMLVRR